MRIMPAVWYAAALMALVGGVVLYAKGRGLPESYNKYKQGVADVQRLQHETDQLKAQEAGLKEDIEGLESDPLEKEKAIRNNRGLLREGEQVYRIEPKPVE